MKENIDIRIQAVSNGFILENATYNPSKPLKSEDAKVFRSMSELCTFISEHFDHRSEYIESDE